jgi:hypothetical protein
MKHHHVVTGASTLIAVALALVLFLRPSHRIAPGPELAAPERLSAAARALLRDKMQRHGSQLTTLVSQGLVLDYDGAARTAGAIFDEPLLPRSVNEGGQGIALPEQFFVLQDALRGQARRVVAAASVRDAGAFAGAFGELTRGCIACHDLYLHGVAPVDGAAGDAVRLRP